MIRDNVLDYIKKEWYNTPLDDVNKTDMSTIEGIQHQLDSGNLTILYIGTENNYKVIKTIHVED